MKTFYTLFFISATIVFFSCYSDKYDKLYPVSTCKTDSVTFSGTISPILQSNCTLSGCHDATASGGVMLTSYAGAHIVAADGRLVGVTTHASGYSPMPKNMPQL